MTDVTSLLSGNYGSSSHEEWLEDRKRSLGGSEANIIAGNSKYDSWYSLWAKKIGLWGDHKSKESKEAFWLGHAMEPAIAARFSEETNMKISFREETIRNPRFPYSHANIDGWIEDKKEGVEFKTCSPMAKNEIEAAYYLGAIPEKYYAQCIHYMAVTEAKGWWLAVAVLQNGFYIFHIELNEEVKADIDILMEDEKIFWEEYVIPGVAPGIDGSDASKKAVEGINPKEEKGKYKDLPELEIYLEKRDGIMDTISSEKEEKTRIENIVKNEMGYAETVTCGAYRVTWKTGSDGKRRFLVKKNKI